jgi:hypothetical protein
MIASINLTNVLIYTVPPTVTSMSAVAIAWIGARSSKRAEQHGEDNAQKLASIDTAVNGVSPGATSMVDNVQALADHMASSKPGRR